MADFAFNIESVNIAAASSLTTLATWPTGALTVDLLSLIHISEPTRPY